MDGKHRRLTPTPVTIGSFFATVGILLAVIGILRGHVPLEPRAVLIALLVSGGSWGVIAWAIARVAFDVESDIREEQTHKK